MTGGVVSGMEKAANAALTSAWEEREGGEEVIADDACRGSVL